MIAIHQSQFLPWIPYFFKLLHCDIFVVLDDVQFQKNGVQNRNLINSPIGQQWITVPVKQRLGTKIKEVELSDSKAIGKIQKALEMNYKRAPFYSNVSEKIFPILEKGNRKLHDLNKSLFLAVLDLLKINVRIEYSSELDITGSKGNLVISIIKELNGRKYLSGEGGLNYMTTKSFQDEGIELFKYNFCYTSYRQLWEKKVGFVSDLSIIDLLFNNLTEARMYIESNGSVEKVGT
jgi:hypothetical protein